LIEVVRYQALSHKTLWDSFVASSKNGTFLFFRDYMDYHSDRFKDHSLLFFEHANLIAVFPANIENNIIYSHGGLTFGGIISNSKMKAQVMLDIFGVLVDQLKVLGISRVVYKTIPHIYHSIPSEEDRYALFRFGARLTKVDISSTIFMENRLEYGKRRRRILTSHDFGEMSVTRSDDFKSFMQVVELVLDSRYGVRPTHSCDEMEMLARRFPDNIRLFTVNHEESIYAGAVVYESNNVAHVQYSACSFEGRKVFAGDFLIAYLINNVYARKRYFDFGISTEKQGTYLNQGLISYKEEFGARAVVYDTFEMELTG
jgi:hypothetical protein